MKNLKVELCDLNDCTACGACSSVCNQSAINMIADEWGYLYPHIDQEKCIGCNACRRACPSLNEVKKNTPSKAIASYIQPKEERDSCSSGGIATALSRRIIKNGGVVYGSVQTDSLHIHHERISKLEDIEKLKGSKYVHSPTNGMYLKVREDLKSGLQVLFIGTPCQVAGLITYLGKRDYENLITVDLCCHGVPSSQFLCDNLNLLRNKGRFKSNIEETKVLFRDKIKDNKNSLKIQFGFFVDSLNGQRLYTAKHPNDLYICGFLSGLFFRENCFSCKYAEPKRVSDLTLSDFWGLNETGNKEMDSNKGVSCILVNTDKGERLLNSLESVVKEERPVSEAIKGNKQYNHPFKKPLNYGAFKQDYLTLGYEKASKRYLTKYMSYYRKRNILMPLINFAKSIPLIDKIYRKITK